MMSSNPERFRSTRPANSTQSLAWLRHSGSLLLMIAIGMMTALTASAAYSPPLGIPSPGFGMDEQRPARPASWSQEIPGYYYINQQQGLDSNAYGHPNSPRRSIPNPLPAGSYVEVHGTYDLVSGGAIFINGQGNGLAWKAGVSGPVWIVGMSKDTAPTFSKLVVVQGSYVYIDTVKVANGGFFQVSSSAGNRPADHIVLRNSEAAGVATASRQGLISVTATPESPAQYVVLHNNVFHDHGDVNATFDQDAHMITIGNGVSNVWLLNNTIYNASGSGMQINADKFPDTTHHIYAGFNHIYKTRQAGLAVKYGSDVIFSQNTIHDVIDTRPLYDVSPSPSKGIGFQYGPKRLWILYNEIYNCSFGISGASTNDSGTWHIYIIGNLIHDIHAPASITYGTNAWQEAGMTLQGGTYRYIINNTLLNVDAGINGPSVGSHYYMHNNIISNVTHALGHHVFIEDGKSATNSTLNTSVLHQPGGAPRIKWGTSVYSLAQFNSSTGQCGKCSTGDPKFNSALPEKYRPQGGSPAVDAGELHAVYKTFEDTYGIDIRADYSGMSRPQGFGWDVGAFEFKPSIPPESTSLTIN